MLDQLLSAIDKVKQTIKEHGDSLAKSEKRTRTVLIDPMLTVLGWDVTDPSMVKIEYNLSSFPSQQVDYALWNGDRVVVFVEAKKLYEPLENHVQQMVQYAVGDGLRYAILTDGSLWEMYDVLKELPLKDKKILCIDLALSSTVACALSFLRIWRINLQAVVPTKALEPIIVEKETTEITHVSTPKNWIAFPNFDPKIGSTPPSHIRFRDGPSIPIKYWNHILVECARRAISMGRLTQANVPLGLTANRHYIHTRPRHPDGTKFHAPRKIQNTKFVIEAHGNGLTMVSRVRHLWDHLGLPISEIFLEHAHLRNRV